MEYYSALNTNELWSYEKMWRNPKCISLNERRQSEKATNPMIPTLWHSGNAKLWSWNSNTLATWCKELTHLKRPWCWGKMKVGGEEGGRVWDGHHHWLNGHEFEQTLGDSEGAWHAVVHGLQKVGQDLATEQQQPSLKTIRGALLKILVNWKTRSLGHGWQFIVRFPHIFLLIMLIDLY